MGDTRLIGNMEIAFTGYSPFLQPFYKLREHSLKKRLIFTVSGRCIHTENKLSFAVNLGINIRAGFAAPLGEKVANLEIFNSAFKTHIDPSLQFPEAKRIFTVFNRNVQQLNIGAPRFGRGIERRSYNGS